MTLDGKVAVVTGAAQGIGQEIAARLAQNGANLVIADLDVDRCNQTVDLVQRQAERRGLTKSMLRFGMRSKQ